MKLSLRIKCFFFPKLMLENCFRRGRINMNLEDMMNHGILIHPPETREKILKESSFEEWYKKQ